MASRQRDNSSGERRGSKKHHPKAPSTLNPVLPPAKRDLNSSIEMMPFNDYMNGGYSSPGQESDSTRISHLKQGKKKAVTNRES
jgi:hypothetical protein